MPRRASHSTYTPDSGPNDSTKSPTPWTRCGSKPSMQARRVKPPQWRKSLTNPPNIMKWPGFCFAFIVRRLATLDSYNTRFPPLPVSRSPRAGADASGPRRETRRNVAGSGSLGSWKGLRRQTRPVLYAPSADSAMALSRESPTVPVDGSMPYSITLACSTPCRCTARHDRRGGRDRRSRHATQPTRSPAPTPAGAAPPCSWWWRTPGPRSAWRTCR